MQTREQIASLQWLMRVVIAAIVIASINGTLRAQNSYEPLGSPNYQLIDRTVILSGNALPLHTAIKPYRRGDIAEISALALTQSPGYRQERRLVRALLDNNEFLTPQVRQHNELLVDTILFDPEKQEFVIEHEGIATQPYSTAAKNPLFKTFYKTPAYFFELDIPSFYLRVNPMLNFGTGVEFGRDDLLWYNQRGIDIRGGIDGKIFFATNIIETQFNPMTHMKWWEERYQSVPDAGLYKDFDSSLFNYENGFDYLLAEGYIGFNVTKHVGVHLGHGKNFIGDGYRSVFMSDFGKNYFYLKLNWRIWKFHYQNIFAELAADSKNRTGILPKKWMAAHYLSFYPKPNLSFGIFEAVIFDREDGQFELQYLNPVILYRSIEHHLGSPDNVLLGFSARWDIKKRVSLYGQIIFDEFKLDELFGGNGWWGNKYSFQVGAKYINAFGIEQLDLQAEFNQSRPFTYTHYDSIASYSNFNQPLSHSMGANFQEAIAIVRYVPVNKLEVVGKFFLVNTAEDTDSIFYGTNILRPNETRNADFGIDQGQGIGVVNFMYSIQARYMLRQNFFLELNYFRRDYDSVENSRDLLTHSLSFGIRWNLFRGQTEF